MKKVGILGINKQHLNYLNIHKPLTGFSILGIFDENLKNAEALNKQNKFTIYHEPFGLIAGSDILVINKTNDRSYNLIIESILNSKHVIIDSPANLTWNEINDLSKMANEANVSIIPVLKYRFSSSVLNAKQYTFNPKYIELKYQREGGTLVSIDEIIEVLLDIIDTALCFVKGNLYKITIFPVSIIGNIPQVISIQLEFNNGCNIFISTNFLADTEVFSLNIYQLNQIINVNLLRNKLSIKSFDTNGLVKFIPTIPLAKDSNNNAYSEILNYIAAFNSLNTYVSTINDFRDSYEILSKIKEKIKSK